MVTLLLATKPHVGWLIPLLALSWCGLATAVYGMNRINAPDAPEKPASLIMPWIFTGLGFAAFIGAGLIAVTYWGR